MVIPTYTFNKTLETMTENCIGSYLDQVDEMIVVEDGAMFSINLQKLADTYIYHKDNYYFTKNVNTGWRVATGEYVAIVNSDTWLVKGNLADLCIPGIVTSPRYKNQDWGENPGLSGSFFVVPRIVAEERGMLDERCIHWGSDTEYNHRTHDIFKRIETVEIYHEIGATHHVIGIDKPEHTVPDEEMARKIIGDCKLPH